LSKKEHAQTIIRGGASQKRVGVTDGDAARWANRPVGIVDDSDKAAR
jgi:hypothetical protein